LKKNLSRAKIKKFSKSFLFGKKAKEKSLRIRDFLRLSGSKKVKEKETSTRKRLSEKEIKKIIGKKYYFIKAGSFFSSGLACFLKSFFKFFRKLSFQTVKIALILVLIYLVTPGSLGAPESQTITTRSQWEAGTLTEVSTTSSLDAIQLETAGTWEARAWAPTPDTVSFGSASALVGDYLYLARGYGDKAFYRYDINRNEWSLIDDLPQPSHYGADISYDGAGNLYFIFGGYSKDFYRYNIENEEWTQLPDLLDTVYQGASIEFDGTDFYIPRGQASTDFWRFDVSENSWYNLAPVPSTVYRGSNMVYGENGKMYLNRGYNQRTFWEYDISSNVWTAKTITPASFYGEQKGAYYDGHIYYLRSNNTNLFYRYDIAGDSWETLENTPLTNNYSSINYNSDDGNFYVVRANGQYTLWKFDPESGSNGEWLGPEDLPATANTGADLIWNQVTGAGAYIFAARGGGTNFYRYDISANGWETRASAPGALRYDTKGTFHDGYVYIPQGGNNTSFYRYDTVANSWTTLAAAPATLRYGSNASYNTDDGYIYVNRGNAQDDFYRYDIAGDSWEIIDDIITAEGTSYRPYSGGRMISDGTDLYLMPGDGESAFLKYDTGTNIWSELSRSPFAQYYGTDMTYYNGKIHALAGNYKDDNWVYDIAEDSWIKLRNVQKYTYNRGPYNGASIEYAGGNSFYALPGGGTVDMWSYTLSASNYEDSGTYVSESIDLSHVDSFSTLTGVEDVPVNTAIVYQTRSSDDEATWSAWEALGSSSTIQSDERRYLQVKIILSNTDGISTPTVYSYSIIYVSEDVDPQNPDTILAYSQRISGDTLVSEVAYRHAHPYFSWSGATDSGSGVAGYYVYYGSDENADPESVGVFQITDSFQVNIGMTTGNYYLRIKTKDEEANTEDETWEAFTYNYQGASPYLTETVTSQEDFEAGSAETTNVSTSNEVGSVQLEHTDGFWRESRLSYLPVGIRYGGELQYAEAENKIYTFRGNNATSFYAYNLTTEVWETLSPAPETVRMGGSIVKGPDGYLYGSRGQNTPTFWRYDIEDDSWAVMASAPKNFYYGASLNYDDDRYVYALPGNEDAFYRYDTQSNQWTTLTNAEFDNPNEGDGQRAYIGSDGVFDGDNTIYYLQGNYYPYFAKYTIEEDSEAGDEADTWTPLEKAPIGIYSGGSLAYHSDSETVYMLSGNYRQNFFKYDVGSATWSSLPEIPSYAEYGASLEVVGDYIYATRGAGSTAFYRFSIEENSWEVPQRGFFGPSTNAGSNYFDYQRGTEMEEDGSGNIYIMRGDYSDEFGVYHIESGEFSKLANLPVGAYNGAAMVYNEDEGVIYVTNGAIRTDRAGTTHNYFMKYTVSTNVWEIITADRFPYQTNYGSSMVYDGDQYIYSTRGSGSSVWYRYDTLASEGSRWSTALPTISGWVQHYGGQIIYKDVSGTDYIYSTRGGNTNQFYRYDVDGNSWLRMADVPGNVYIGGSLSDGKDGYLYATRGYNSTDFYRYDISNNTWSTIEDVPAQVYYGGSSIFENNYVWTTAGSGTNSYRDGLYSYLVSSEGNDVGFEKTGSYQTNTLDLTDVYHWANLEVDYSSPNNTSLVFYTRSSSDESEWSAWDVATNKESRGSDQYLYNIVSPVARYIQIKAEFSSSDQVYSSLLKEIKVNYYQDIVAPNNPSTTSVYSDNTKTTEISTSTWYSHPNPYFEWPEAEQTDGASDGIDGSGVAGYYVYFGTNAAEDPFVSGMEQTNVTYEPNDLISGDTYYLKIKTIDNAGKVSANSYTAFIYEYDATVPTNPTDTAVTPAGYTAADSYSFLWEADAADLHSGLSKLQYQTGGDGDTWYDISDPATISLELPNLDHVDAAYQSGKNWFYLRTVDQAGNVSTAMEQAYYFSLSAPSPPRNLTVTPVVSTSNNFSFEWEQPESFIGDESKLKYLYSINTLPNAYNTITTTLTAAGPGPFATQKGANRIYVVAMDEAENVDYELFAHVDFEANTTAPGAPINVQIFDTSDRENEEYSVAVKWTAPGAMDEENFSGYVIYSSEDQETWTQVATTSGTAYVDTELESKMYYYYLKAKDNTNNLSIASSEVSIIPTGRYTSPPTLVTEPEPTIHAFEAEFTWATNRVASSFIEYGKSMSLSETTGQVDSVTAHLVEVKGLSAETKYYYRAKYIDPDGNIGMSDIYTIETFPPPTISEVVIADIGLNSATISWSTNASATCTFKYGEGSLGSTIEESSSGSSHVTKLSDLNSSSTYKFQIDAIDGDLNEFSSDEYNFTTLEQPMVSDLTVENKDNVDLPTVIVKYKTSLETTTLVKFKYDGEASFHNNLNNEKKIEHEVEIEGLAPSVEYEIVASGTDAFGVEAVTQEVKIKTRADSRPPGVLSNRAVGRVIGRGKNSNANMYVKIETDESTTAKIFYNSGVATSNFEQSSAEDPFNTYHLITIPVDPGQAYSYIVKLFDESGNETVTKPSTIVVEGAKQNATEIVTGTFVNKFNWMTKLWE
jgi:hypothetical protein